MSIPIDVAGCGENCFVIGRFTANTITKAYRRHELKQHEHLYDDMTPKYSLGCKRIILSELYYDAMARPNVRLHSNQIDKIVNQTIYTKDGENEEVDVSTTNFTNRPFYYLILIGRLHLPLGTDTRHWISHL